MDVYEAQRFVRQFYDASNPTEEQRFLCIEALNYLIEETHDPAAMVDLGGIYYGERAFDLALKYYEMAAEYDDVNALSGLGYIWYYGRTGQKDYEKAFHYYERASQKGDIQATYKVADMYKNGYYVQKDVGRYRQIIESLYPKVRNDRRPYSMLPEIFTRLARIRADEGRVEEALKLYDRAREVQSRRIRINPFFGDLNIMKWMIEDIYRLRPFDRDHFELYDLYALLKAPIRLRFFFEGEGHEVACIEEDGAPVIRFDGDWYRSVDDFFRKAELDGERLTTRYEELYDFEVIE